MTIAHDANGKAVNVTGGGPYREPGKPGPPPVERTVPTLMKLLATITGWGDQTLSVTIGYKRARDYDADGDSTLNPSNWGYTVSTKIGGTDEQPIHAQGKTLELALEALAKEGVKTLEERHQRRATRASEARAALNDAGL